MLPDPQAQILFYSQTLTEYFDFQIPIYAMELIRYPLF